MSGLESKFEDMIRRKESAWIQELLDASRLYNFDFNIADSYYCGKRVQLESFMMGIEMDAPEPFDKLKVALIRYESFRAATDLTRIKYYKDGLSLGSE